MSKKYDDTDIKLEKGARAEESQSKNCKCASAGYIYS